MQETNEKISYEQLLGDLQTSSALISDSRLGFLGHSSTACVKVQDSVPPGTLTDRTADIDQLNIVDQLERGLERNEFMLVFQPKLRVPEERLSGFEASLRWRHPIHGILTPTSFIRDAENSGLSGRFTDFILEKAAETLSDWAACKYTTLSLVISLSPQELTREDLPRKLIALLASHAVDTAKLQIQLTESSESGPLDVLLAAVDSIRDTGVRVAIGDFGAGGWSPSILHRLAVDVLKIDRSLINGIPESSEATNVLEVLVRIGQRLGKQIVIDGIENEAQLTWTKNMSNVDCQGSYICMPVHAAQIDDLVAGHGLAMSLR
ncbi:EAL domain-containing protein [Paraburkholderia sp. SG-MS1]|uniref:EAL domain-containing protein n=1 Tax=Paraburkholderia sp. SG-MS1 TaxID=2023741 RepID=UPI001447E104|nr:EAL domain-containing protein [Paraburkholderia sp. SG-MS1]